MLDNDILFYESQRFKQWWLWLILIGINGFFLFIIWKQIIEGQAFGDKPMGNSELLIAAGFTFLLTLFFLNLRLETQIKKDGIYVRYFPFHLHYKRYPWKVILRSFVRQYSPISEYGGWGVRLGLFGKGKAFNVSGDQGLQLEFFDHKKLLIGTNKPDELKAILYNSGQIKP